MRTGPKRGLMFSTDAIISVVIIFFVSVVMFNVRQPDDSYRPSNVPADILTGFAALKMEDTTSPPQLITDPELTVLEQIGVFYAKGEIAKAQQLADIIIEDIDTYSNFGIWVEGQLITSRGSVP